MHFKDEVLNRLSSAANVAQFASFGPQLEPRYSRMLEHAENEHFADPALAAAALLSRAASKAVNVRSYLPDDSKSKEFIYGITSASEVDGHVRRLARAGLYTILNETIDIHDGGVSGVALGDTLEFAPDDTPRCVEKPGTVSMPRLLASKLLSTVYGFVPALPSSRSTRIEFSLHPVRRGVRNEHTVIWEAEDVEASPAAGELRWPNRFSRLLGDKAFGLLVAHHVGLRVPRTTVVSRRIAPFTFGRATGSAEPWLRTAPSVQVPGKFSTRRGWADPFALVAHEDKSGADLSSVLAQEGVDATYSGAAHAYASERGPIITIEGTEGFGDRFMLGTASASELPRNVLQSVRRLYLRCFEAIGYVRFEWVASASGIWIVQLHSGDSPSLGNVIFPGEPSRFVDFLTKDGLERLRALIPEVARAGEGIRLVGDVGVTSHFGDILRKARVPSLLLRASD